MMRSSAVDTEDQHSPGYRNTGFNLDLSSVTKLGNTSWDRILELLISPDGQYTPYLVLCSATLAVALVLLLLFVLLLVAKRRRSLPRGLSLKYLYLKTAESVEFIKLNDYKNSHKREPSFPGKYALLDPKPPTRRQKPEHVDLSSLSISQHFSFPPFTCVKKAAIVSYLSFRVFYTFIFTFSVALSMLFSLWPPYLESSTVPLHNPSSAPRGQMRGFPEPTAEPNYNWVNQLQLAQRIAFSREAMTDEELSVQVNRATQLVLACQQLVITQVVDVVRELDHVIQKLLDDEFSFPEAGWNDSMKMATLSQVPHSLLKMSASVESAATQRMTSNIFHILDKFVMCQMNEFHQAVQDYLRHLKTEIEYIVMPDVALFSDILSRVHSSQWLLFARRMLNSTNSGHDIADSMTPWWKPADGADSRSSTNTETRRSNMSKIDFARQLGLAEAENFLWTPTRIEKGLEDSIIALTPPSKLMFWLLKNNSVSKITEKEKGTKGHFKPMILRSFYPSDDDSVIHNVEKTSAAMSRLMQKPHYNRYYFSNVCPLSKFYVLTLAHIRLIFFILDCFVIVFRFYNTYIVLKEILIGKSVVIDASNYLTVMTSASRNVDDDDVGRLNTNRSSKNCIDGRMYKEVVDSYPISNETYMHALPEEAFYYCGHHSSQKAQSNSTRSVGSRTYSHMSDVIDNKTRSDHSSRSVYSYRIVRPAQSVDEVSGSCISSLRMNFSRTNQFIIILLGCALFLFLAFLAIFNGRGLLFHKQDSAFLPGIDGSPLEQIIEKTSDALERQSNHLVRQHARHLNSAFLAFTRRNEKQLRQRMSRFTARIRHDLLHIEGQLQQEKCEINKSTDSAWVSGTQNGGNNSKTLSSPACAPSLKRHAEFGLLLHQEMCQFLPISYGGFGRSKSRSRPSYASQRSGAGIIKGRYPSNYFWHAVATWLSGSLTQSPSLDSSPSQPLQDSLLSQFLVALLCISVIMFGLVGVVRLLSCIFRLFFLEPRTLEQLATTASGGVQHIRLLSPCPPPSVYFSAEFGFRSVWAEAPRLSSSLPHAQSVVSTITATPAPSTSEQISPVRIVGTVLSGGKPGQYVLLSNSSPSGTYCSTDRRGQISVAVTEIPPTLSFVSRESDDPITCSSNSHLKRSEQTVP